MQCFIDIETSAGIRCGRGPITSATLWQHTPRLDGAGEFSFTMPASDPMVQELTHKRIARCYAIVNGALTDMGAGIIDTVQTSVSNPTMVQVSGPDLMGELAYDTVGRLIVCEQDWVALSDSDYGLLSWVRVDETGHPDPTIEIPNAHDGNTGTYETIYLMSAKVGYPEHAAYLYVGHDARFDKIRVVFAGGDYANNNQTLYAQYYNGSGWAQLTIDTDGTAVAGTFQQDGDIEFTRPTDWTRYHAIEAGGDWFWVRLKVARTAPDDPSWTGYFKLAEITVYADVPTKNGVNLIMGEAASTWTRTGYDDTVSAQYLEFDGESVLEALLTLAEQGGVNGTTAVREHFRLGTGRAIDWMGDTVTASGVRAIAPVDAIAAEGHAELCIIHTLTERADTSDIATRIYPRTGDGITLALATDSAPDGYSMSSATVGGATHYYAQHTAGAAAYGNIERWVEFSELSLQQADSYTTHPEMLANQLLERSVEWLRTHAVQAKYYSLAVAGFSSLVDVGDTIEVVYHEWADGEHTVDIDTVADGAPLFILGRTIQISSDGVALVALDVSTVDREAQSDAGVVVGLVRAQKRTSSGASNAATIAVTGGGQPPTAGADIRTDGYRVQRAGAGVLLFSGSGALLVEYSTITAALADAAAGDWIDVPAGTWVESFTVAMGITLRGAGLGVTIISGAVLCYGTMIDLTVDYTASSEYDLVPVRGGNSSLCIHVGMTGIQSGSGDIIPCVSIADSADTPMECYDCVMRVSTTGNGNAWWPGEVVEGGLRIHHGSLVTEIP